jgi:S1-C subfamily serine protease
MLDAIVILLCIAAAIGGYRLGFLVRALSWVGLGLGLYVAARFLPRIVSSAGLSSPISRLLLGVVVLIVCGFVGQLLGLVTGSRLNAILPTGPVRSVDKGVGAVAGALGVLVLLWLLIPSLTAVPGYVATMTENSAISRWLGSHVAAPPDTFQALRRVVGSESFPQVFKDLVPGGAVGSPPTSNPLSAAVTASVSQSMVKVEGQACDEIQDGSGFAVAPNLIVTNAHVVAGESHTQVLTYARRVLPATVVQFDANRDLALLQVGNLGDSALPLANGSQNQEVAVFGHPQGQTTLAIQPARIARQLEAVGDNLYGTAQTRRSVLVVAASLQPGDSGGAVVDTSGSVVGVAFAIAEGQSNTAYALSSSELRGFLAQPHGPRVSTGGCLSS